MKILITGSQGFLGRNLSQKLSREGFICYGIGRGNWKNKNYKKWGYFKNINGTISNKNLKKFEKINFDYILHCAGGVSPNASLVKFIPFNKDYEKNVISILTVLEFFSKKKRKPKIIFISTVSVYGNSKLKKIKEETNLNPVSNYSINKVIGEKVCRKFYQDNKFDILILRGSSLYGPGLKRQIIYDVCSKIQKRKFFFFGSGREIRDFIHISDFSNLIRCIINKGFKGYSVFNAGTGKGMKISKVIYYIGKKFKVKIKPKFNYFGKEVNPTSLIPDIKKVKKFNWSPKINFYEGLDEYIKWFKYG